MEDLGLNKYLQPINTPIADNKGAQSSYSFDSDNERNTITLSKIKSFSFSSGTGGTLQLGGTANGNGVATVVDTSGSLLIDINADGITYFGSASSSDYYLGTNRVGELGFIGTAGLGMAIQTFNNFPINFFSDSGITIAADTGVAIRAGGTSIGTSEIDLLTSGGIDAYANPLNVIGTFQVNGVTKTAIVPTSKGYKAMYCTESPNVWFTDIGTIHRPKWYEFWKEPTYTFDPLFLETVEKVEHIIPTMNPNIVEVKGKRKGFENVRMEDKTVQEFYNNNEFWGQADK